MKPSGQETSIRARRWGVRRAAGHGLTLAVDMARLEKDNDHGVAGRRFEAINGPENDAEGGFAQHGGLGP